MNPGTAIMMLILASILNFGILKFLTAKLAPTNVVQGERGKPGPKGFHGNRGKYGDQGIDADRRLLGTNDKLIGDKGIQGIKGIDAGCDKQLAKYCIQEDSALGLMGKGSHMNLTGYRARSLPNVCLFGYKPEEEISPTPSPAPPTKWCDVKTRTPSESNLAWSARIYGKITGRQHSENEGGIKHNAGDRSYEVGGMYALDSNNIDKSKADWLCKNPCQWYWPNSQYKNAVNQMCDCKGGDWNNATSLDWCDENIQSVRNKKIVCKSPITGNNSHKDCPVGRDGNCITHKTRRWDSNIINESSVYYFRPDEWAPADATGTLMNCSYKKKIKKKRKLLRFFSGTVC